MVDRKCAELKAFARKEDGSLIALTLFVFVGMALAIGLGIDVARHEVTRTRLQNTLDTSALAAASLRQSLDPTDVVEDHFARAGILSLLSDVDLDETSLSDGTLVGRGVDVSASALSRNLIMKMVGQDTWSMDLTSEAVESVGGTEISLVVDLSSSMQSNNRLTQLSQAADDFIDLTMTTGADTTLNIVPFQITVNLGEQMAGLFSISTEHALSDCVLFQDHHYTTTALTTTEPLLRYAHFDDDHGYFNGPDGLPRINTPHCQHRVNAEGTTYNQMRPMLRDPNVAKAAMASLVSYGGTGIDHGMKWGVALLDPSMAGMVDSLADLNLVTEDVRGRPAAYGADNAKVLVLMSDGGIDGTRDLHPGLRSGPSNVFYDADSDVYSVLLQGHAAHISLTGEDRSGDPEKWYWHGSGAGCNGSNCIKDYPFRDDGGTEIGGLQRLDHSEVFDRFRQADIKRYLYKRGHTHAYLTAAEEAIYYNLRADPETDASSAARMLDLCAHARNAGITIYTIAFEADAQSHVDLMTNCASSPAFAFEVDDGELGTAFSAIAVNISSLRLTQ